MRGWIVPSLHGGQTMKFRRILATVALVFSLAPGIRSQSPDDEQGTILTIQGRVEHSPATQQGVWTPASVLQKLFENDQVKTYRASRASILFIDETQVKLNAGAELTVQAVKKEAGGGTIFDLLKGEGWFRTKNPRSGLTIRTTAATAAIRGTEINTTGSPVLNLKPAVAVAPEVQRDNLDLLAKLNREHQKEYPQETALEARIQNYELAARMQLAAANLLDISKGYFERMWLECRTAQKWN